MAYNVLKGNVQFINSDSGSIESIVDDHSDQTIAGRKTFSTAITSSGFFDSSDGGSPIVSSPISSISNAADERIAIFSGANTVEGKTGLTYNDTVLAVTGSISSSLNISGSEFYGSGGGLTNLKATSITGQVNAANISLGNGLTNTGGAVAVSGSDNSITIAANGISINGAGNTSGLVVGGSGIRVDPNRAGGISGGSLAGADEFLVADNDQSNALKKATITNLQTYMQSSLTFRPPAGSDEQIQFNDSGDFGGDNTFLFNNTTKVVTVSGISASLNVSASQFYGDGINITNINATALNGNVPAGNINIGNGLFNDSNSLAVSASFGLRATSQGLEVTASNTSGLDVTPSIGGVVVSPSRTAAKGSPIGNDLIILGDSADGNKAKNTTLTNIVTLMQNNGAAGANTQVQFNNSNAFAGDSTFTFNSATNTLTFETGSVTGDLDIQGNTTMSGTLQVNVDRTGTPLITLDKGENDAAEIEFKNNGITVGEIYSNSGESLFIRSVALGINLRQGTDNVLIIDSSDTTFGHRPVTINQDLTVTGSSTMSNVSSSGNISASFFYGDGSNLQNVGGQSSYNSFTANFSVANDHDVVGIVTTGSAITASFALANQYGDGQRFTFKDVSGSCSGSNHIVIATSGGQKIDGQSIVKIQTGYGAISIASDGVSNFYIVGTN